MSEVICRLVSELSVVVRRAAQSVQSPEFDAVGERLGTFATAGSVQAVQARSQPVVDEWLAAAVRATPEPWADLAALLGEATPYLPWIKSYENLEPSTELSSFQDFYSYQLLVAPSFRGHEPPVLADGLLVGFSLQAPGVLYPAHHHAPAEMYGVISGTIEWQLGDHWSVKGPGDIIMHRSHESHAMRTLDEPVLTWVAWPSHPDCDVFMPSLDPPDHTMEPITY